LRKLIKDRIFAIILIPLSFLAYLAYVHIAHGDWNLVFSSMKIWHQDKMIFPFQTVWRYFKILVLYPTFLPNYWIALLECLSVLLYTFLLVFSYKKIRFSYWIFFAISILIPALTGTFQGMPRYGLHLYPFFLSLALFFEKKDNKVLLVYFTGCMLLGFLFVMMFTRGYFVA